jgi:hypothetical protein
LKNRDIEQAVFEEFLKVSNLTIENLSLSDHPDLTFLIGKRKVGVELSELLDEQDKNEIKINKSGQQAPGYFFGPEKSIEKIRTILKKKINKDYSLPDHEIWLLFYTNHVPMDHLGKIFDEMPQIEQLVAEFMSIKKNISRVIIFEMWAKKIQLEMSRC